ncbi:MAG: peptidoglycan-binding protein [Clostridia bacterium]|nr:peptidoglycan-binding protein [Clostridia bacterium]
MLPTIKRGAKGDQVKAAQCLLACGANGKFDAAFEAAVKKWQEEVKLDADGVIGPASWRAMAENAPLCSTARNKKSEASRALQLLLGNIEADGIFGSRTKAAVVAFQAAKGLDADGICGKNTWLALICGELPGKVSFVQPVDYKQADSRWGSLMYSCYGNKKQTIANSGCGPTAMADVVATLKDAAVIPPDLCELAVANGHRSRSGGTAWSFFPYIQEKFGFSKLIESSSLETLKACLDGGGYAVCSMGPGYWTKSGHFICVWKYDNTYIYANDPASKVRKKQKQSAFLKQRKRFFCFCK